MPPTICFYNVFLIRYTDYEADAISMHLMAKAGFDPAAVPSLLGLWAEEHQKQQQQVCLVPTGSPTLCLGRGCWSRTQAVYVMQWHGVAELAHRV